MFAGLREFLSPTIAAAAVLLIVCSVLLLVANEMLRARARGRTIAADPAEPN
jgi:putative spermidine/putrescine transport system permease protein